MISIEILHRKMICVGMLRRNKIEMEMQSGDTPFNRK